jgi:signal transduction histidine kinase
MRVSRIINHTLWTASEQEVKYTMKPLNISEIITDTTEKYRSIAKLQSNTISISAQTNLPPIFGNEDQLVQVVNNLLTNANNHTKNGVIEIIAEPVADSTISATAAGTKRAGHLQVTITDNGTGIPPKLLPHIFKRGITGSADKGGTGMGLPISQNIIKAHGGEITIETTQGKGTSVMFTLPVYDSTKEKAVSNDV